MKTLTSLLRYLKVRSPLTNSSLLLKIYFLALFLVIFLFLPQTVNAVGNNGSEDPLKKGIDYIYNLEFEKAGQVLGNLREKRPDDPAPYFYTAMIYWGKLFFNYDRDAIKDLGLWLDKTIEVAEKKHNAEPGNGDAVFYMGGAYGFKGRIALIERSWLQTYYYGKKGNNLLIDAENLAPANYDIMLGRGMYNYFLARVPSLIKVLSFLLFLKGDSDLGIQQIELCAAKGTYAAPEARIVLASIYTYFEKKPEKAIEHLNILVQKYPDNPRFLYTLAIAYSKMRDEKKALIIATDIEDKISKKSQDVINQWVPRTKYLQGEILFEQKKYSEAMPFYLNAITAAKGNSNDWVIQWSNMKLGMINDVLKNRELAKEYYRKVIDLNEIGEENVYVKNYAKQYISTPFVPGSQNNIE